MHAPRRSEPTVRRRLEAQAEQAQDRPALSARSASGRWETLSRADLCERVAAAASLLRERAPGPGGTLVGLPNGVLFYIAVLGSWWAGRTPLIVPPGSTDEELRVLFSGIPFEDIIELDEVTLAQVAPDGSRPPPADEPREAWYLPSGGSTGLPHLVPLGGSPADLLAGQELLFSQMGWRPDATQLVMGPLFHAAPFVASMAGLVGGNHVVVIDRFTPTAVESAVDRFPPNWCQTTPTHMAILDLDEEIANAFCRDLRGLMHTAAPCPERVRRSWISRLGGENVFELYGSTEIIGAVVGRGADWMKRPGSTGKPFMTELRIVGRDGTPLAAGEVGEVFMRTTMRTFSALDTAHLRSCGDGFFSVGDLGYLDDDGYLYLTDRVNDVILVGGANVSAREVELTLLSHPAIREAIVVGRPHRLLGQRVCAVVVPTGEGEALTEEAVQQYCEGRLAAHKVPVSVEFTSELHRSPAGKIQRYLYREDAVHGR